MSNGFINHTLLMLHSNLVKQIIIYFNIIQDIILIIW